MMGGGFALEDEIVPEPSHPLKLAPSAAALIALPKPRLRIAQHIEDKNGFVVRLLRGEVLSFSLRDSLGESGEKEMAFGAEREQFLMKGEKGHFGGGGGPSALFGHLDGGGIERGGGAQAHARAKGFPGFAGLSVRAEVIDGGDVGLGSGGGAQEGKGIALRVVAEVIQGEKQRRGQGGRAIERAGVGELAKGLGHFANAIGKEGAGRVFGGGIGEAGHGKGG